MVLWTHACIAQHQENFLYLLVQEFSKQRLCDLSEICEQHAYLNKDTIQDVCMCVCVLQY